MTPTHRGLLVVVPLVLAVTLPAEAVVVAGGGPTRSDCYAGFEVAADHELTVTKTRVDQKACGGSCTFGVKACSGVPVNGCTVAPLTGPPSSNAGLAAPSLTTPGCGDALDVALAPKGRRPGKRSITLVAKTSTRPKRDKDKLRLRCLPNPDDAGCGGPPSDGSRVFSITTGALPGGSHFFSSAFQGEDVALPNSGKGSILFVMGTPGSDGVASLVIGADSIFGFQVVDQSFACIKVEAAGSTGKIDCDGGTPVDVISTGDSHGSGANDLPVVQIEQGAPGRPGDGYVMATARAVNCPVDGAGGGCLATLGSAADCANPAKIDFSKAKIVSTGASTTGMATARTLNPKPGSFYDAAPVSRAGEPFDCANFVENGPGILETPTVIYDNALAGDNSAVLQGDD